MPVPHDPAHHARLTFRWRNELWHLLDKPHPAVVLISDKVTEGNEYPDLDAAEEAFWRRVTDSILAETDRLASARWPGVEIAAVRDKVNGRAVLVERSGSGSQLWTHDDKGTAVAAFQQRLCALIAKCEDAA
jgi:hypothetical protein